MNENDRQNEVAFRKNIIRLAFIKEIYEQQKRHKREKLKAEKLSQKQFELDLNASRARKTSMNAKVSTAWEEVRRIEFNISVLEEEIKKLQEVK